MEDILNKDKIVNKEIIGYNKNGTNIKAKLCIADNRLKLYYYIPYSDVLTDIYQIYCIIDVINGHFFIKFLDGSLDESITTNEELIQKIDDLGLFINKEILDELIVKNVMNVFMNN